MKGQRARFGGRVVGYAGAGHEAGHAGHGHNVPLVLLDHGRQELAHRVPVAEQVDAENLLQLARRRVDDGVRGADSSVVDENGRVPNLAANRLGGIVDGGWVGNVASLEVDVVWGC